MHAALALLVPAAAARMLEFDVTLADGERRWLHLPWGGDDERRARDFCALYSVSATDCARVVAHARGLRATRSEPHVFAAFADEHSQHPASARLFALLDGELMFRSTGTSNTGRNYPNAWLPSAGVVPFWFQRTGDTFADWIASHAANQTDDERFRRAAVAASVFRVFDKRYGASYADATWPALEKELRVAFARLVDRDVAMRTSADDVTRGAYILARFSSLEQLVASVRLGRAAWEDLGYGRAASYVLEKGSAAGLRTAPVDATTMPDGVRDACRVHGMCAVNDHITALGFNIHGWREMRNRACAWSHDTPSRFRAAHTDWLQRELANLTADAVLVSQALGGPAASPRRCDTVTIAESPEECAHACCVGSLHSARQAYFDELAFRAAKAGDADRLAAALDVLDEIRAGVSSTVSRQLLASDRARAFARGQLPGVRFDMHRCDASAPMRALVYGTAWKREATADLVVRAIRAGFRSIDTACQPKHYREDLVGAAIARVAADGFSRESLFLQTKFTPIDGQDPDEVPYDTGAPLAEQVRQSFATSLRNLRTDYVDSLLLHSPLSFEDTLVVWREFEALFRAGKARRLGISNCYDAAFFIRLFEAAEVKPSVLQNRFYNRTGYDGAVRRFCRDRKVAYQSFWTLTANKHALTDPIVSGMADRYGQTPACVFYRALVQMGITPLSGTSSEVHMRQDVEVAAGGFELEPVDVVRVASLLGPDLLAES